MECIPSFSKGSAQMCYSLNMLTTFYWLKHSCIATQKKKTRKKREMNSPVEWPCFIELSIIKKIGR